MSWRDKLWMWGYTQEGIETALPFTGSNKSCCSLARHGISAS